MVKTVEPTDSVLGGDTKEPQYHIGKNPRFNFANQLVRHKKLVITVALLVLLAGCFWYWQAHRVAVVNYPSSKVARMQQVDALRNQTPKSTANIADKIAYYDNLTNAEANAGNYQAAIDAFNARVKLSTDGLTYQDYILQAQYYQKVGNKQGALNALSAAEKILPPDNNQAGYFRSDTEQSINKFRQELEK